MTHVLTGSKPMTNHLLEDALCGPSKAALADQAAREEIDRDLKVPPVVVRATRRGYSTASAVIDGQLVVAHLTREPGDEFEVHPAEVADDAEHGWMEPLTDADNARVVEFRSEMARRRARPAPSETPDPPLAA
jgi:hypothetical protein